MVYFLHMKIQTLTSQVQKQILAPTMQQSIEVLMLPLLELHSAIELELQNNPLLEIDETKKDDPESAVTDPQLAKKIDYLLNLPDIPYNQHEAYDEFTTDHPAESETTLEDTLLQQLRIEINDPKELAIGELLIGNIDENGYLTITLEEISQILGIDDIALLEKVLQLLQKFNPPGIASRNLKECLLNQLTAIKDTNRPTAVAILNDFFEEMSHRKYPEIARKLKKSLAEIKEAVALIAKLDPKPARNFRPIRQSIYIKPDIIISEDDAGQFKVNLNNEGIPLLRINYKYKDMMKLKVLNEAEKTFIRDNLQNAVLFLRSIEQRGQTVKAIAQYIIEKQQKFFTEGASGLIPMSLKDIAEALGRNESTISRAISNKYADTPQGVYPLKFFFSQAVGHTSNEPANTNGSTSNRKIKEAIKDLIEQENPTSPLSDNDIQDYFSRQGLHLARRTIAKYRQMENILPSYLRKRQ
jgi:RNA polymerase sigma-54 factor